MQDNDLRDNDWQRQVAEFMRRHKLNRDPATCALDLVSEVGELTKELLVATDYGQHPSQFGSGLLEEFGDALCSLLALAEVCDVDADEALRGALRKYERRLAERGEAGSQ
jgi:NTP pyrophosphatase (non-canonical NTP hydrolase)